MMFRIFHLFYFWAIILNSLVVLDKLIKNKTWPHPNESRKSSKRIKIYECNLFIKYCNFQQSLFGYFKRSLIKLYATQCDGGTAENVTVTFNKKKHLFIFVLNSHMNCSVRFHFPLNWRIYAWPILKVPQSPIIRLKFCKRDADTWRTSTQCIMFACLKYRFRPHIVTK